MIRLTGEGSPAIDGGRGLKHINAFYAPLGSIGSPAIDGGRGLKLSGDGRGLTSRTWIARHRWRARIETPSADTKARQWRARTGVPLLRELRAHSISVPDVAARRRPAA